MLLLWAKNACWLRRSGVNASWNFACMTTRPEVCIGESEQDTRLVSSRIEGVRGEVCEVCRGHVGNGGWHWC